MHGSEMTAEQKAAHNEKMKLYMRDYRKRRKLAGGALNGVARHDPTEEAQSHPQSPPDAI